MRLISSQEVLEIPIFAEHLRQSNFFVVVADGILDSVPTRAILDGHHDLFAARWLGVNVEWIIERTYGDEDLFRAYLAEQALTAQHPWFFLDSGNLVEATAFAEEAAS